MESKLIGGNMVLAFAAATASFTMLPSAFTTTIIVVYGIIAALSVVGITNNIAARVQKIILYVGDAQREAIGIHAALKLWDFAKEPNEIKAPDTSTFDKSWDDIRKEAKALIQDLGWLTVVVLVTLL